MNFRELLQLIWRPKAAYWPIPTPENIKQKIKSVYIIGSLRNEYLPKLEAKLNKELPELETFLQWFGAGKTADDSFKEYHKGRGLSYKEALQTAAAKHIYEFDRYHLDRCEGAILVLPAGKSCALEAGYTVGKGKPLHIFFSEGEPEERWEIMLQFGTTISYSEEELISALH